MLEELKREYIANYGVWAITCHESVVAGDKSDREGSQGRQQQRRDEGAEDGATDDVFEVSAESTDPLDRVDLSDDEQQEQPALASIPLSQIGTVPLGLIGVEFHLHWEEFVHKITAEPPTVLLDAWKSHPPLPVTPHDSLLGPLLSKR